jgi:hypothetical protein
MINKAEMAAVERTKKQAELMGKVKKVMGGLREEKINTFKLQAIEALENAIINNPDNPELPQFSIAAFGMNIFEPSPVKGILKQGMTYPGGTSGVIK